MAVEVIVARATLRPSEGAGLPAQECEITKADAPPGAAQESHEGGVRCRVMEDLEDRHDLSHLRHGEHSSEPEDIDGDIALLEHPDQCREVGTHAREDRDVLRLGAQVDLLENPIADPLHFLFVRVVKGHPNTARAHGVRG
ncbi:unannotated protein [freshwater metagenome]|uniref:Unannotated protein n=1 Tax=freshwater metagenome TaxID=449393 RepID=A0A6J7C3W5_9ZZZZ